MEQTIDNFSILAQYLFEWRLPLKDDEFYFLQILVRGKDGNKINGNNKNRLVKYYLIRSKEQLLDLKDEIVGICNTVNGRAYIHPTRRSQKTVANLALELTSHTFVSQNWIGLRGVYSTAAGKTFVANDKQFVVDLDNYSYKEALKIYDFINSLRGKRDEDGHISQIIIPTKNGYHLIANAFEVDAFKRKYPDIDIHKNNPTLLYYKTI